MQCLMTSKSKLFFFLLLCLFSASATFSPFDSLPQPLDGVEIVGEKEQEQVVQLWNEMTSMAKGARAKNTTLVLADERTHRKDLFNGFHRYSGGWNISNFDYLTSVLSTAAPFFAAAVAWFVIFAIFLLIKCACYYCCNGEEESSDEKEYSKSVHHFCLILLILCTISAIGGCTVLYTGQWNFSGSTSDTLDYVVRQAQFVAENLRNVSSYFDSAEQLVNGIPLPIDLGTDIDDVKTKITSASDNLSNKTNDNSKMIHHVIEGVRLALIVVAAVMLFIVFLGFLFSLLGWQYPVNILVVIGWILVTSTLVLCGAFLFVHNVTGDTCVAMDEWVLNPTFHTALDDILPCVENATVVETFLRSRTVTYVIVDTFDQLISNVANGNSVSFNQSGPLVPLLCNPLNSNLTSRQCASGEVTFENATEVWKNYTCQVSSSQQCTSQGRLTPPLYTKLAAAVNVTFGLFHYGPFFVDLVDCTFARKAFSDISSNYCPGLRKYTKWVYLGTFVVSVAVMLSLILWIVYVESGGAIFTNNNNFS